MLGPWSLLMELRKHTLPDARGVNSTNQHQMNLEKLKGMVLPAAYTKM